MVVREYGMNHYERYNLNRKIVERQLKSKSYSSHMMKKLDKDISDNKQNQHADFTKNQYEWLDTNGVNLTDLYFSSDKQRSMAMRVRYKSLFYKGLAALVYGVIFLVFFGGIAYSFIEPLTQTPQEKCQNELGSSSAYYCKEDGSQGNYYDDERAKKEAECASRGPQWAFSIDCYRVQYNSKQECIDAGEQKTVNDEYGTGFYECRDDGKSHYVSEDEMMRAMEEEFCDIKGNISYNSGERIYHVPGQTYYDETVIDEAYGERWFCSESAAVSAGWRKAYE